MHYEGAASVDFSKASSCDSGSSSKKEYTSPAGDFYAAWTIDSSNTHDYLLLSYIIILKKLAMQRP